MSLNSQMFLSATQLEAQTVGQVQRLRPANKKKKSITLIPLTLTSLIDCFTILVAYLLAVSNVGTREVPIDSKIQLPVASHANMASESTVIRYRNGQYILNDKVVSQSKLVAELESARKDKNISALMIQADKRSNYESLNPLVLSGLQAGYQKISFAVLMEGQ